MNIKHRINARKIVLSYFYEKLFVKVFANKQNILDEIFKLEKDINYSATSDCEKDELKNTLSAYYQDSDQENDIEYITKRFFEKEIDKGIDFDYIKTIASNYTKYEDEIIEKINQNSVTFKVDEMDIVDRVIFFIGYIEFKTLGTDKNVVLNEMIELAKRYGDDGSPKLINGILHNILE